MFYRKHEKHYIAMILPGMIMLVIFSIVPMFGVIIAFKDFVPAKGILGSEWVGLKHFTRLFSTKDAQNAIINTMIIACSKMVLNVVVPVFFALVLNEVRSVTYKRMVQTVIYLPHFLSWVILGVMFSNIFSLNGLFNSFMAIFGMEPSMHMISNSSFRYVIIGTDVWKNFGYGTIIYIAAITNINPDIYEAADLDGANRWQKILHVTLPSIVSTVILMATLALGNVLNAGFDQIFAMYSPLVYETGDIIDTYVYRMGLLKAQFSYSTAVGLFKSGISFVLISLSYILANKFAGYTIF